MQSRPDDILGESKKQHQEFLRANSRSNMELETYEIMPSMAFIVIINKDILTKVPMENYRINPVYQIFP